METSGFMTDSQIKKAIDDKEIIIHPFCNDNLKPVGYNFSFSRFIFSLSRKNFVDLLEDKNNGERYFNLKPNETVLILTRETVAVSKNIGGTLHSKVSLVALGLSHVSTTLDPGWQGQLLVPMNNPTKKSIKVVVEKRDTDSEYLLQTFLTLVFFSSDVSAFGDANNKPARIELLKNLIESGRNSRKRAGLLNAIEALTSAYSSQKDLIDLSTSQLRRQNHLKYKDQQDELSRKLQAEYPKIRQASQALRITDRIKFISIAVMNAFILVALSVLSYVISNVTITDIMKLVVTVLIPFSIFFLNSIKDRYI